jgi:bacterial/archaeal transporter family protein
MLRVPPILPTGGSIAQDDGMLAQKWLQYALLSALCASLVGIFGKVGMKGIDANLATAFRSVVQALFVLAVCTALGTWTHAGPLHGKAVLSIIAAGVAGGASWLFYFKALQAGTVAQVAPIDKLSMPLAVLLAVILLGDRPTWVNWAGILMIAAGAYLAALPRSS